MNFKLFFCVQFRGRKVCRHKGGYGPDRSKNLGRGILFHTSLSSQNERNYIYKEKHLQPCSERNPARISERHEFVEDAQQCLPYLVLSSQTIVLPKRVNQSSHLHTFTLACHTETPADSTSTFITFCPHSSFARTLVRHKGSLQLHVSKASPPLVKHATLIRKFLSRRCLSKSDNNRDKVPYSPVGRPFLKGIS